MDIKNSKINEGKTLTQAAEQRGKTLSQSCKTNDNASQIIKTK